MKKYVLIFITISLCLCATPAMADSFGDMIAKDLCATGAGYIALGPADSARYDNAETITGQYKFKREDKASISASFSKNPQGASCKKTIRPYYGPGDEPMMGTVEVWPIVKNGDNLGRVIPKVGLL